FHVDAVSDVAVGFSGIAEQRNLIAFAADKCSERVAELIPGGVSPDGIVFGLLLIQFLRCRVAIENGAQDGHGTGSYSAVVQINFILRNEKLAAHLRPECVFVRIEQGTVGKRRSLFNLRQQIAVEGERSSDSSGCSSEEVTAVEHETSGTRVKGDATEGAMVRRVQAMLKRD